jgi:F-type H+-transporting ATPase subunit b
MTNTVLLSLGEAPLIDIDGTAFVQFGIFTLTAIVATRFLFRPYLKMRDEREAGMEGARKEAESLSAEADAKLADYEEKLAQARSRAQEERRKIRTEASEHLRKVTDDARNKAQAAIEEADKKVREETVRAREELLPKADALATDMVSKLLGRKVA